MAKKLSPQMKKDVARLKLEMQKTLVVAANEAVNFFTENFTRGGFLDRSTKKWDPRKHNVDPGRGTLIGKGGGAKLWRSISRTNMSQTRVEIGIKGPAAKYASVHNFGLRSGRPKGGSFNMPQRKFMGESQKLNKKIVRLINKRIKRVL